MDAEEKPKEIKQLVIALSIVFIFYAAVTNVCRFNLCFNDLSEWNMTKVGLIIAYVFFAVFFIHSIIHLSFVAIALSAVVLYYLFNVRKYYFIKKLPR